MLELDFHSFPKLQTQRLLFRKLKLEDKEAIFEIRSNAETMKYIPRPVAKTMADAIEHIENVFNRIKEKSGISWAIEEKKSKQLIGTMGFWRIEKENYRGEIGYILNPKWHNKGIMHEALSVAIPFAFEQLQLHSIEAVIDPENIASAKLLEKNNFRREGLFKENCFYEGKFLDSAVYSLVKGIDYKL
jgi:ribosomal-protein-alanine N-acetyltransferase